VSRTGAGERVVIVGGGEREGRVVWEISTKVLEVTVRTTTIIISPFHSLPFSYNLRLPFCPSLFHNGHLLHHKNLYFLLNYHSAPNIYFSLKKHLPPYFNTILGTKILPPKTIMYSS